MSHRKWHKTGGPRSIMLLVVLMGLFLPAFSQMLSPLAGQGDPPMNYNATVVYVSAILDKLLLVDERQYGFEAVLYLHLSWEDPRAYDAMQSRTAQMLNGSAECTRLCSSNECCDTVWLPAFHLVNAEGLSQNRVDMELVSVVMLEGRSVVERIVRFSGRFYSPMSFKRFPIDCQNLFIVWWAFDNTLVEASSGGTELVGTTTGPFNVPGSDDLSSWKVKEVTVVPYEFTITRLLSAGSKPHPDDPSPLLTPDVVPIGWPQQRYPPDTFAVKIKITRLWSFYFISYVLPVMLCVVLSWACFLVSPRNIETRLSVTVALFLSLCALQFVISTDLPQSADITKLGWTVFTSYLLLFLSVIETLLVYSIYRWYVPLEAELTLSIRRRAEAEEGGASLGQSLDFHTMRRVGQPPQGLGSDGVLEEEVQEQQGGRPRPSLPRKFDLRMRALSRRFSIRKNTFRDFKAQLMRDRHKALMLTSRIERLSMLVFPSFYFLFLAVVFGS